MTSKFKKGCLWGAASGTALICALAASGSAHASGFQVRETSGTLQGSSFAGMSTLSTDASTMFYNPGTVGQYKETSYSVGGSLIMPVAKAKNIVASGGAVTNTQTFNNGSYKDMAQDAFVPNAHAVWKLNDQLNMGISITSPWGLVTDYEPDFAGRFYGTTSKIKTSISSLFLPTDLITGCRSVLDLKFSRWMRRSLGQFQTLLVLAKETVK